MDFHAWLRAVCPPLRRAYEADYITAGHELSDEVRQARSAGMMLDPADFRSKAAPPDNDNAATYLRELGQIVADEPNLIAFALDVGTLDKLASIGCSHEKAVNAAWQASKARGGCDLGWEWERGLEMEFTGLDWIKDATTILCATARIFARDGRFEDARRMIAAAFRVAKLLADDPIIISHIVRIRCECATLRALCAAALKMPRAEDRIAALRSFVEDIPPQDVSKAFRGEGFMGFALAGRTTSYVPSDYGNPKLASHAMPSDPATYPGIGARRIATVRKAYQAAIDARPCLLAQVNAVERVFGERRLDRRAATVAGSRKTDLITPSLEFFLIRQAHERLVDLFARLLEFQDSNGEFPRKLPDWGEACCDGFVEGRLFDYRRDGDGFVLAASGRHGFATPPVVPGRFGLGNIGQGGLIGLRHIPGREPTI